MHDGYSEGAKVVALYKNNWYHGEVKGMSSSKEYSVLYDDNYQLPVPRDSVIFVETIDTEVHVGATVFANFDKGKICYPGTIRGINQDGTYAVSYDDGDDEEDVARQHIHVVTQNNTVNCAL